MKYIIVLIAILSFGKIHGQVISTLIDEYVTSYEKTGDFNGCILISEEGKIIYENCFGDANHSFDIPNKIQTKFKIGSVSKQFTAAAILLLEQEGYISTADTISKFFQHQANAENITIQQLLTHTSGITDIYNIPDFNKLSSQKRNISDLSEMLLEAELDFNPGSRYQYSNGGYTLLAQIIELVSGETYQDFLANRIFTPLAMTSTGHNRGNEIVSNLALGYDPTGYSDLKITDFLDPELLKGSGSLYSTIHDLHIWINSIKNKTLLTEKSYKKLLTDYGHNYGYGISVYETFDQSVFGHDGRVNGYITDYLHYKESDVSIIILGNIQTGVTDFFRRDIASIVFNQDYKSRAKTDPPGDTSSIAKERIQGTYSFGPNFKVYVEIIEGSLQARANEGGYSELILLNDGRFFNRTLYSYIEFRDDDNGTTSKMVWTNNDGNTFEGIKLNAQDLEKKVDEYLAPLINSGDFYGSVLFAKDGKIELVKGYGLANLEHGIKNSPQTIFHIASVNKPITSVGIMLLHQNGKLSINDTVSKHLPDFPNGNKITIKNLLSQTSGIPSYNRFSDYQDYAKRDCSLKEVVDWFKDEDLLFEPGSEYGYSNSNFVLLAYIIEIISGSTYQNFMYEHIFAPLQMEHTKPFKYDEIVPNRAEGYDPANSLTGLNKTGLYNNSIKTGSGALYSTVGDLFKLDQALYGDELLTPETKKLMFTSVGENEYGLGWGIWQRFEKSKHDHDGASPGSVAYFSRYPDDKVTIIFLGNINTGAFNRMKYDLAAIYFNKDYKIPEAKKYISLDAEFLTQYEGRFEFENGNFFDLKVKEGALRFLWRGRGELGYLLSPLGQGKFYMRARGDQIEFRKIDNTTEVYYTERSGTSKLNKIE